MEAKVLNPIEDRQDLACLHRELEYIRDGLALLGLKQCSCCRKFFRYADGTNLLNAGELVCFGCVGRWWEQRSPRISIEERHSVERQLLRWLTAHHGAKVIPRLNQMPAPEHIAMKMVLGCELCNGRGQSGGARCRNCDGRGSEWVVVPL